MVATGLIPPDCAELLMVNIANTPRALIKNVRIITIVSCVESRTLGRLKIQAFLLLHDCRGLEYQSGRVATYPYIDWVLRVLHPVDPDSFQDPAMRRGGEGRLQTVTTVRPNGLADRHVAEGQGQLLLQ